MKRIGLILCLSFLMVFQTNAEDLFSYDAAAMEQEMAELTQIEEVVLANPEADAAEINNQLTQSNLVTDISLYQKNSSMFYTLDGGFTIDDMDWGSFAWGFCCCCIGFFVVGINNEKTKDQQTSYWIGVLSSLVWYSVGGGYYGWYY